MTGAAARDTVLIGATGAYAGAFASSDKAIAVFIVEIAESPDARRAIWADTSASSASIRSARRSPASGAPNTAATSRLQLYE